MAEVTFLLPAAEAFGAQRLRGAPAQALGRADRVPGRQPGRQAQLRRHFELPHGTWPMAALSRQADAGDAQGAAWLRADPAWVRPDINGARLLACGQDLGLAAEDAAALLPALQPLLDEAGIRIDAPHPARWYLRLAEDAQLPGFPPPAEAVGMDLAEQLDDDSHTAARWRALLTEIQIVLHNHPWNARRAAAGPRPVNSLWLWGGGVLPAKVASPHRAVASAEEELQALAAAAGARMTEPAAGFSTSAMPSLVDLRFLRDLRVFGEQWLLPAVAAVQDGSLGRLVLDLADGSGIRFTRAQRLRFWRRPQDSLAP
ncbi:phosphoglycerate mutase [Luteimonas sp. JM171]|uniref:phosphoglycerate mutase n=1 Tax=Luteimonas sp. JM171 TaxID=1896164 RepID=UPI000855D715|nr:phosphoglycerate mutase [Luteimonas sp. JM171]AOH37081.1 hypothetical protein BGP89_12585 [Luteimonas sp. JM171]